jgi:hypothetical protein
MLSKQACFAAASGLALAITACGPSIHIQTDFNPQQDFSGYKTYVWAPPPKTGNPRLDSPLLQQRIQAAVDSALAAKGYVLATTGEPDFYVGYYAAVDQQVDVQTVNSYYGGAYGWGWYGGMGGMYSSTSARVYDQGTLIVDVADAKKKEIVWRGSAQAEVNREVNQEERQRRLNDVAKRIFADFPPKPGK